MSPLEITPVWDAGGAAFRCYTGSSYPELVICLQYPQVLELEFFSFKAVVVAVWYLKPCLLLTGC